MKIKEIRRIAELDFYTEGPALDREGNIYFTTMTGGEIIKIGSQLQLVSWAHTDLPNGQIILPNEDHLICDSGLGKILRFSPGGQYLREEMNGICGGIKVNVPNDLVVDKYGNLYFTDSVRFHGSVFFIGANGQEAELVSGLDYPNGIVLSRNGKTLYVAESYRNRIISIDLTNLHETKNEFEVFIELPYHESGDPAGNLPDGIAINKSGLMAVAHYGMQCVRLVSVEGELIGSLDTGMQCTSNVFFMDEETLIVTGGYKEPGPGSVMIMKILNQQ
ncbi:MAG TPA: SMP-30/gluconolactonase/LRE family protein [Chitinophagaceae bacterium]|nr:SMP-30/gluconolactonase/LRE family protein [Chitinophagaceae bacterium]